MEQERLRHAGQSYQATDPIFCSDTSAQLRAYKHKKLQDGCNNHRGIVSLPICHIVLKALKPERKPYPKELKTYGDHLRKKRLDLNLSQPQVAKIICVTTDTITNWELNRVTPTISQIPKIISFLKYTPILNENEIKNYRIQKGISQLELAKILQIDPTTLSRIERAKGSRINNKIKVRLNELLNSPIDLVEPFCSLFNS